MRRFAAAADAIAATTKKTEKVQRLAAYFREVPPEEAARAAVWFTGRAFPRRDPRVLQVGGALLWRVACDLTGATDEELEHLYRRYGDLGEALGDIWRRRGPRPGLAVPEVAAAFEEIARRRGAHEKLAVLRDLFARAGPGEAQYLVKILTGELRIGLKESLVEEAIALAYRWPLDRVRRVAMLTGDIARTLELAAAGTLEAVRFEPFTPIAFMLATPVESAAEIAETWPEGVLVEAKYDGIRAQAHKDRSRVVLYSRTLDELVEFPELGPALAAIPGTWVLDGEIVAWRDEAPLPFTTLQTRLGRVVPDLWLLNDIPVVFMVFDLLALNGALLIDCPLVERRRQLEVLVPSGAGGLVRVAPARRAQTPTEIEQEFAAARQAGHEGLVAKAPQAPYTPGQRGRHWLKLKAPLATLDAVVTAVEWGHGKRHALLSDYTFAVRHGDRLVNVGKAYSGLTDAELRTLTAYFLAHTLEDQGYRRLVEPTVVIEVAFNNIQRSTRHESGYALRFPRIVRLRPDKTAADIDTLDRVRALYEHQRRYAR